MNQQFGGAPPGTALLGEVVTWDMESTECSYQDVLDALVAANLPQESAKELQPGAAFSRACKHLKENRTIDKLSKPKGGIVTFQFTKKHLDAADNRMEFDYECLVTLNTHSGQIECPENVALEKHAQQLFAHAMQTRNAQDVTRLVQKLFKDNADLFPVNPRKGVAYFVCERHRSFTEKVDMFLHKLGGTLWRFPVPAGTTQGNLSVKDSMENGLSALVEELDAVVTEWDDSVKQGTIDRTLAKYEKAVYKVNSYADYLGDGVKRLLERIDKSKQDLIKRAGELKPADAA